MHITKLIEKLKAMPEKMEGINSKGEMVVFNTHRAAQELKKSLRNCDVGTPIDQVVRHKIWCTKSVGFLPHVERALLVGCRCSMRMVA